ncbi:MAG: hypothetical protein ACLPN1_04820 [Dissulfurispiraceae bacterium]|jgi:hypothetical protein
MVSKVYAEVTTTASRSTKVKAEMVRKANMDVRILVTGIGYGHIGR